MTTNDPETIQARLCEPFSASEIQWREWRYNTDRSKVQLACYVDARAVMERLDDVVGVGGWQTSYTVLHGGDVACSLKVKIGGEWLEKTDVGNFQTDKQNEASGMAVKGAFSDALKRAAVQFGIGRYLYSMPKVWADYDPKAKMVKVYPEIPEEFLNAEEKEMRRKRNGKYVAPLPPTDAPKPAVPAIAKHAVLWKNLSLEQQSLAKPLADDICEASGPKGSKEMLGALQAKMLRDRNFLGEDVFAYLENYFAACWEMTPALDLVLENEKADDGYASVPY